jgi:S1-C subfamily serine protease
VFKKPYRIFLAGALIGGLLIVGVVVAPAGGFVVNGVSFFTAPVRTLQAFVAAQLGDVNGTTAQAQTSLFQPASDYEAAVVNAVKRASPAVVSIVVTKDVPTLENCPADPLSSLPTQFRDLLGDQGVQFQALCNSGGSTQKEVGGGSGFIISSDGLIATNKHVVDDKGVSYTVLTNDGKKYPARVLASDPVQDIAIVKIDEVGLPTVVLGDSDPLQLGQTAIAIGNSLGEFSNTVSVGVISGLSRDITASGRNRFSESIQGVIQTDAAINPGNSGGPLLNLRGEVVGINTAVATGAQNIGFAIPINQAKRDITSVKTVGTIQSPYLGVRYRLITPALATDEHLALDHGALVSDDEDGPAIAPNSPAATAGLKEGDIIYLFNGSLVDIDHPLSKMINNLQVGSIVVLTVNRNGGPVTVTATLGQRPQ